MKKLILFLFLFPSLCFADMALIGEEQQTVTDTTEYILGVELTAPLANSYAVGDYLRGYVATTDSTGGKLTKICAYIGIYSPGTDGIKLAISETSGGDPSGQDLVEEVTGTITGTGQLCVSCSGSNTLSANTAYLISMILEETGGDATSSGTDASYTAWRKDSQAYSTGHTDPLPTPLFSSASQRRALWGVYEH